MGEEGEEIRLSVSGKRALARKVVFCVVCAATLSSAFPLGPQWSPLQSLCCGVNFLFWACEVWAPDESSGAPRRPATSGLPRITTQCKRVDEKDTLGTLRQRGKAALEQLQRVRSNWQMYSEAEQ